jgi:cyclic pyranopterin phosphate synthase
MDKKNNFMSKLSHIDKHGNATMVDVSQKAATSRVAVAQGSISMKADTLKLVLEGGNKKGDVFAVSRIAGIQAAKNCSQLIPLCHPLMLTNIKIEFDVDHDKCQIIIRGSCQVSGPTGVEMEALTAVSVAALTIYDMCKAADKGMVLQSIYLLEKEGGQSGRFSRV